MPRFPQDVKYSQQHLWLSLSDGRDVRVGVTAPGVEGIGTIVHVDLPIVGSVVQAGDVVGAITGPTTTQHVIAPLGGMVTDVNSQLPEQPDLVRTDPWGAGWLFEVELPADVDRASLALLDAAGYEELLDQ